MTYTNDFADFITDALKSEDNKNDKIVSKLLTVYYSTFDSVVRKKYSKQFKNNQIRLGCLNAISDSIKQMSDHDFFTLKYEIVFRLGRIDNCSNDTAKFLEFIYNNDRNVRVNEDSDYYVVVLKRCCAISCSFLGFEKIELDYVKKMMPYNQYGKNSDYDINYDLANRSHTLLFYGDVTKTGIFNFKDQSINNPYELAFSKRIRRLELDLPRNVDHMNKYEKKKYYFRVFDLATIYTFMFNRKRVLSEEELKIVSNTKVNFTGASTERNNLMKEILDLILLLNKRLNQQS